MLLRATATGMSACLLLTLTFSASSAQNEKIIYSFPATADPTSRMAQSESGKLYATGQLGGANGSGSVVELKEAHGIWRERDVYAFSGVNGRAPISGVLLAKKVLFGTTDYEGPNGHGTLFSLTPNGAEWNETTIHSFTGGADGSIPFGYLFRDKRSGYLFGTTAFGGAANCGTVYSVAPSGAFTTLYSFEGGNDGCSPYAALSQGPQKGTLVGATFGDDTSAGTIFELKPNGSSWSETVIYQFTGGDDGNLPTDIDVDGEGNIFGVTYGGGAQDQGVVFELSPDGHSWKQSVLYSFGTAPDGWHPEGIIVDKKTHAIYGAAVNGGVSGNGAFFKLVRKGAAWKESVVHGFSGGSDGSGPDARPIIDAKTGALYGTTASGGQFNGGTVYEITQ